MASRPIDEKIVKLSVDNADFKSKLIDSLKALGSMNGALKGINSGNLSSVTSEAAKAGTAVEGLGTSAEKSQSKFSILAGAASVALGNIASKALTSGMSVVKSLTIDPVMDGYKEYTEKLSAIQVMKSNTTASMDEINASLAELNTYSDKTIYKFSDMTNAVGQMTTAGVGLTDSVTATTGAFNLAAASGMDTVKANGMVQFGLTQAMTKGFLGIQDLVSFGAAGGKKFQDMAHSVADELGIGYDKSVSFRDSLQSGWLNTQVLTETMRRFGQDQSMLKKAAEAHSFGEAMGAVGEAVGSGWASVWEALIGNYDQATELWTNFQTAASNAVQAPLKGLTELTKAFVSFGGRTAIIDAVSTVFTRLTGVISSISKAWMTAFPNTVANSGKLFADIFKLLADAIKIILAPLQLVGPAFQILFGVLNIGVNIIKLILTPITTLFGILTKGFNLGKTVDDFTNWTGVIKVVSDALNKFFGFIRSGFATADKVVANATKSFVNAIVNVVNTVKDLVQNFILVTQIMGELTNPFALLSRAAVQGTASITPFMAVIGLLKASINVLRGSLKFLGDTFKNIGDGFKAFFGQMTFAFAPLKQLSDHFKAISPEYAKMTGGLSAVGQAMQPFVQYVLNLITHLNEMYKWLMTSGGAFKNFSSYMTGAGQQVRDFITNIVDSISGSDVVTSARQLGKDIVDGLTIGIKNQALDLFAIIKPALDTFISSIKDLFDIHSPSRVMQEIGKNIIDGLVNGIKDGIKAIPAVLGSLGQALGGIGGIIVKAFSLIPKAITLLVTAFGNLVKLIAPYSDALGEIFSAIGKAVSTFLNEINTPAALKGGIIIALVGWIKALGKTDGVGILSKLLHPIQAIKDALSAKFGSGAGILDQLKGTLKSYQSELRAKTLIEIAGAVGILAGAMWVLSTIPGGKLITAAGGMAVAAGSLIGLYSAMGKLSATSGTIDIVKITATVIGMSIALGIMASAVNKLSGMNPEGALVGVVAMGAVMFEFSKLLKSGLTVDPKKELVNITTMIVVALALSKLAGALEGLSKLSWSELGVGVAGLGAVVAAMAIVVNTMKLEDTQSVVGFTGLALALNLAVVPVIALGLIPWEVTLQGVIAMGGVLLAMTVSATLLSRFGGGTSGAMALLAMATALNMAIIPIVALGLMPWQKVAQGIVAMSVALGELLLANIIMQQFGGGTGALAMVAMAAALNMIVGPIVILGALPWQVVAAGLVAVGVALAIFVGAGALANLVLPGMLALAAVLSSFSIASLAFGFAVTAVTAGIALIAAIIVTQAGKIVKGLGTIIKGIGDLGPLIGEAVGQLIGGLISGLASAIANNISSIMDSAVQIVKALVAGLLAASDTLIDGAMRLIEKLLSAILDEIPVLAVKIGSGIMTLMNTLATFITNNTANILAAISNVMVAILTLITTALADMVGKIPGVGPKLKKEVMKAGKDAADGLKDTFPPGMNAATQKGADEAVKGLSKMKDSMKAEVMLAVNSAKDPMTQFTTYLSESGVQGADQFVQGVKSGSINAKSAGAMLSQAAKDGVGNKTLTEVAKAMGGSFANGIFTPDVEKKTKDNAAKAPAAAADGAKGTDAQKAAVKAAGGATGQKFIDGILEKVPGAKDAGDKVKKSGDKPLGESSDNTAAGAKSAETRNLGISSQQGAAIGAAASVKRSGDQELGGVTDHSGAGSATASSRNRGISGQQGAAAGAGSGVKAAADNPLSQVNDHSGAGSATASSRNRGIAGQTGAAAGAGQGVTNAANNPLSQIGNFQGAGQATAGSKVTGVYSKVGEMQAAAGQVNSATDSMGESKDFSASGSNMVNSLVGGIRSAWDVGKGVVSSIGQFISDHLKANSPTKAGPLHDDWYGIVGTGAKIVTEISKNMKGAIPKLGLATDAVGDAISSVMTSTTEQLSDLGTFNPTITPVVDMSNLENLDLSQFDSLGGNISADIMASVQYNNMNQATQQISQISDMANGLNRGFNNLQGAMYQVNNTGKQQVDAIKNQPLPNLYLDKQVVSKQLAPDMQQAQNNQANLMNRLSGGVNFY